MSSIESEKLKELALYENTLLVFTSDQRWGLYHAGGTTKRVYDGSLPQAKLRTVISTSDRAKEPSAV